MPVESAVIKHQIQALQKDVISLLGQTALLMDRASRETNSLNRVEKYGQFQQEIIQAARNVEELRLRMAIAAPMKAGKSTIINTIIGQPLLPSRNAAMTTLPTEIVLDFKLTEPVLHLSPKIISVFQTALLTLQQQISQLGKDKVHEKTAEYPHLSGLIQNLTNQPNYHIPAKTSGCEAVHNTLANLNDIVRLCNLLVPDQDPLKSLTNFPQIHTPFWGSKESEQSQKLGKLVIVDTPGPNEAGEHQLAAVVAEQLQQSSMVLIVLDFTQLKTQAAEQIKEDVQKVIQLRGKENLYVLINKVDQRRDGDMNSGQVRQFVVAEFGIDDALEREQVFEVSAIRAFSAANFISESEQNPGIAIAQMQSARSLAKEVFGIDWEEELEDATSKGLLKKAQNLWHSSGFPNFLDTAINLLIESADQRCIKSALNITNAKMAELYNDAKVQNSALLKPIHKIQQQIDNSLEDLYLIELWQNTLLKLDELKHELNSEIDKDIEIINSYTKRVVKKHFFGIAYQRTTYLKKAGNFLLKIFSVFESVPIIWNWLKSKLEFKSSKEFHFTTNEDAENFMLLVLKYAIPITKKNLIIKQDNTNKILTRKYQVISKHLANQIDVLNLFSYNCLNEAFNNFLPTPQVIYTASDKFDFCRKPLIKKIPSAKVKIRPWYLLWLLEIEQTIPVKYIASLQEVVEIANYSINESIKSIKKQSDDYIENELKQQLDEMFKKVIEVHPK